MVRLWCRVGALGIALGSGLAAGCEDRARGDEAVVHAAGEFRSADVDGALSSADTIVQTRGFVPEWAVRRGFLVERDSEVYEVTLAVDSCYVSMAAGSVALTDIDLRLFAANGNEVAKDAGMGPTAALGYCPPHPGTHYLAVRAGSGTGLFGVRLFQGPPGLDIRLDDLFRDSPEPPESSSAEHL